MELMRMVLLGLTAAYYTISAAVRLRCVEPMGTVPYPSTPLVLSRLRRWCLRYAGACIAPSTVHQALSTRH